MLTRILIALPPLLVVWVIWDQWPLVPVWDQWFLIPFFEKVANGDATLSDWVARHQGEVHHIVVPRIIFAALAFASDWTMKLEVWVSFGIALVTLRSLLRMTRAGFDDRFAGASRVAAVFVSALVFSLVQIWNWLWGFSLMLFLINACVVVGADWLRGARPDRFGVAVGGAAACCFVASFSMAHGILSWIALAPAVLCFSPAAKRARYVCIWILSTLATWGLFLWGYSATDAPTAGGFVDRMIEHPLLVPGYFLIVVGSPIAWAADVAGSSNVALTIAAVAGLAISVTFVVLLLRLWPRVSTAEWRGLVAWGCIGSFGLLYAGLNTLGRAKPFFLDPSGYALARVWLSMYATPSGLVLIAATLLAARALAESASRRLAMAAVAALGVLVLANDAYEIEAPENLERDPQELCFELMDEWAKANTCMNLIAYGDEIEALRRIGWRSSRPGLERVDATVAGGIIGLDPAQAGRPDVLRGVIEPSGALDSVLARSDAGRSAVLVSQAGSDRFFTYRLIDDEGDASTALAWELSLDPRALPRGSTGFQAWLYDRASGRIAPLGAPFAWNPSQARVGTRAADP